ncbi:cytochrome P450 [Stachybotrys elegans]|uniref:Bifunctional cytochrome P450/NADPH--P450 reductase n=1 Tax=Stachybotrys elegans TaxID=80388 RepID=A0A8K0SVM6_9HYPO|nr:cytochrome P450 [Stachybotrys elegans]
MSTPIPGPPAWPFIGNLRDVNVNDTVRCFGELADTYGPIFKLHLGGDDRIFICSRELVDEVCSRKEFVKIPIGSIKQLQVVTPDGLFTAPHGHEAWAVGHRTLLPAFGPLSIRAMLPEMLDITSQAVLKWARFGEHNAINVTEDFTRLTLDTIALCSMDTRFNSFYQNELHPFPQAIRTILMGAQGRSTRPAWLSSFMWNEKREFDGANEFLHKFAEEVITKRRNSPPIPVKQDLLDAMLNRKDPVTGKHLDDALIIDNMITFLIAGHETTAGLLSFLFYLLVTHPSAYTVLQKEVDDTLGNGPITIELISKLQYTKACVREALRLRPTAAIWGVSPINNPDDADQPIILGNQWLIKPNQTVLVLCPKLHRDPSVFGVDADEFKPDRMLEDNFKVLPKNCWKPFGNGARACIGSDFAMQEAIVATAALFQKFDFKLADPDYKLSVQQTLTLKPKGFFMKAKLRPSIDSLSIQRQMFSPRSASPSLSGTILVPNDKMTEQSRSKPDMKPLSVFYASNMGTCKGLADRLMISAVSRGFLCTVRPLDEAVDSLPVNQPILILVASYEEHPGNAQEFLGWIQGAARPRLGNVYYTVFGCGNRDWHHTFQTSPILVDQMMEKCGATRLIPRGVADASQGDVMGDWESWQASQFWPTVARFYGKNVNIGVDPASLIQGYRTETSRLQRIHVRVTDVKALTQGDGTRVKYHMEVELPQDVSYSVGDYLEVHAKNSKQDLERLFRIFKVKDSEDADPLILAVWKQLELNQPATTMQIESLHQACLSRNDKGTLSSLIKNLAVNPGNPNMRPTVLQILVAYPSIPASLNELVAMLPPLRPRLYSISSSPLHTKSRCTLTRSAVDRQLPGLASGFLASLQPDAIFEVSVRRGKDLFRPPLDLASVPMIMVCIGTGIAPFRGFVQHRVEMLRRDPSLANGLAPALLYAGFRKPEDALYVDELERWQTEGAIKVRWVYSETHASLTEDEASRYVQGELWANKDEAVRMWDMGARVYVCGSRSLSKGMREMAKKIYSDVAEKRCGTKAEEDIEEWWADVIRERYAVDVF